ncbi:MAG: hypothetical protein SOX75_02070 [Candidatus Limivicinus sp.]|nr:hypothetical protein [Candidatus Limivicinus sp.]
MDEYIRRDALIAEFERLSLGENSLVEKFFAHGVYNFVKNTKTTLLRTPETERYVVSMQ